MRWAAVLLAALALTGCQTSAERSAKLEKASLAHLPPGQGGGLKLTRTSTILKIGSSAVVHDAEGVAAVVTVRNDSGVAQQKVPLEITVRDATGATLYANTGTGISSSLTSISYIPAHGTVSWVDDQVQASGTPATVTARIGEGTPARGQPPRLETRRGEVTKEASGTEVKGTAINRSSVKQKELVIYAISQRAGMVLAAGRAVLPELAGGASAPFSILLIGAAGPTADLNLSAPATTLR